MHDDFDSVPNAAPRPVAVHDHSAHTHHYGALPLITAMLGVFLVLETIALGYLLSHKVVQEEQVVQPVITTEDDGANEAASAVPFFYVKNGKELMMINPATRQESLVYTEKSVYYVNVFAVPQVDYAGKMYVNISCSECDASGYRIKEVDVAEALSGKTTLKEIGSYYSGTVKVSPDQTKFAYIPVEAADIATWETGNELVIVDLVAGGQETVSDGTEGYFFSTFGNDEMRDNWLDGYSFDWIDRNCVRASVYARPEGVTFPANGKTTFVDTMVFCEA